MVSPTTSIDAVPKVSVCMITFNHERYINAAIQGVLAQHVNFPMEIIIGEDCSTDSTRSLVRDWKSKYPESVHLLLPDENIGMAENFRQCWAKCSGEFIAVIEGDDIWTCGDKLQLQFDLLNQNPDYNLVFHPARILDDRSGEIVAESSPQNIPDHPLSGLQMISQGINVHTCTTMIRRAAVPIIPSWFDTLPAIDFPLFALACLHGHAVALPNVMATYRRHAHGMHTSRKNGDEYVAIHDMYLGMEMNLPEPQRTACRSVRHDLIRQLSQDRQRCNESIENLMASETFRVAATLAHFFGPVGRVIKTLSR